MSCGACEQLKASVNKGKIITKAWIKVISNDPVVEALSEERMKVCMDCDRKKEMMKINGNPIYKCGECNCPLIALTRSEETCKLGKWK